MKYFLFLCISLFAFAEIVEMDDGTCYEQKGKMLYVAPCPSHKRAEAAVESQPQPEQESSVPEPKGECFFRLGEYQVKYLKPSNGQGEGVSCIDAQHYIDRINLGYDSSLKKNKKYIGKMIIKRALSQCNVEIYYGDFITIGLMSGDRLMCDDFMVDLSSMARGR